jgi:hypothetical protein
MGYRRMAKLLRSVSLVAFIVLLSLSAWATDDIYSLWIGQSNCTNLFLNGISGNADTSVVTPNASTHMYNHYWTGVWGNGTTGWQTPTGDGMKTCLNALVAQFGNSMYAYTYAVPSTTLVWSWTQDHGDVFSATDHCYSHTTAGIAEAGHNPNIVIWFQGEAEGSQATCTDPGAGCNYYAANLTTFISKLRTKLGNPTLPIFIVQLGRVATSGIVDSVWSGMRTAQASYVASDPYSYLINIIDVTPGTGTASGENGGDNHYYRASYVTIGSRLALAIKYYYGGSSYYQGPHMRGFKKVDSTHLDVYLGYPSGTGFDFTPTSSITGFTVLNDGSPVSVTSAAKLDTQTVRLTTASTTWGTTVTVRHCYGANPTVTGLVVDATTGLPLEPGETTTQMTTPVTLASVSGTLTNGSTITVSGGGFGAKTTAAPVISSYDNAAGTITNDFDHGASIAGSWTTYGDTIALSSSSLRSSHKKVSYGTTSGYQRLIYSDSSHGAYSYISFWQYRDYSGWEISDNNKFLWNHVAGASNTDGLIATIRGNGASSALQSVTTNSSYSIAYSACSAYQDSGPTYLDMDSDVCLPTLHNWDHWEFMFTYPSPITGSNGIMTYYLNGKTVGRATGVGICTETDAGRWYYIGLVTGARSTSGNEYLDEVYIDNIPAHILLSDSASVTWPDMGSSHHSEIQVASAWTDSSIQFKLNQGSFANGSSVYLYVIDPNGNISAPYSLTLLGGGTSTGISTGGGTGGKQ